jgi:hypothetical protein
MTDDVAADEPLDFMAFVEQALKVFGHNGKLWLKTSAGVGAFTFPPARLT